MGFFVISAPSETTWTAAPGDVDSWVRQTWPEVVSHRESTKVRSIVWEWPDRSEAYIEAAGQAIYIEALAPMIARFAAAFTERFARSQSLILYDEGYTTVVPLNGATEETVRQALDSPM